MQKLHLEIQETFVLNLNVTGTVITVWTALVETRATENDDHVAQVELLPLLAR